jgi:ketosteroid isomerase-like protein
MSPKDVEVAEASFRLWNQGDRDGFLAAFHPEGRWSSAIKRQVEGGEGLYRGREESASSGTNGTLSGARGTSSSPRFAVHGTGASSRSARFQGIGAGSGIDIERTFGWVFQVENGLIREARTFLSREEALEAAGLRE